MAKIKQVITFDQDEADELREALNGRAVAGVLDELRTHINAAVQPAGKGDKRTRLLTGIKAGSEVTEESLSAIESALRERTQILTQLANLLGENGERTRALLEAHERAEKVTREVADQLPARADAPQV